MKSKDQQHIKARYEEVSKAYDEAHLQFDIQAIARKQLFEQFKKNASYLGNPRQILDLASGTGNLLFELGSAFPDALLHGLDLSEKMTEKARKRNSKNPNIKFVTGDALCVDQFFTQELDLLIAQFLLAYVDTAELLKKVNLVLKPGGVIAITSTTLESFPEILNTIKKIHKRILLRELPEERIESYSFVPKSQKVLCESLFMHGFEVFDQKLLQTSITFQSFEEFRYFAIDRGWFLQAFDHINVVSEFILKLVTRPLFPFTTTLNASMILARKNKNGVVAQLTPPAE